MWFHSSINTLKQRGIIIFFLCFSLSAISESKSKYVILITIDGMREEMVSDSTMPSPYLKMMRREGLFVPHTKGIGPSSTYPSHTTIVTGAKPASHQIFYNSPFAFNQPSSVSYWYADSIKSTTIWEAAKRNNMTTASLFWPVSTNSRFIDYNVPEFWSTDAVPNQMDFIKPYCTPAGILDELEKNATGKLNNETFRAGTIDRDARTAYMANYIFNKYKPNLMTIHLITTDYVQHATGLKSEKVSMAVSSADNALGLIIENLKQSKMMDSTAVIVCGDHGFTNVYQLIAPNCWLVQEKLLSEKPGGEWKACFHGSGATMFLYLKDKNDKKTLKQIYTKLNSLPDSTRKLFRIVEKEELAKIGCSPDVSFAIEPVKGVGVATARTGKDVYDKFSGKHGYLSGIDPSTLLAFGSGVEKKGLVDVLRQVDIAPYIAYLLGIDFQCPDGKLPLELIK